MNSPSAPTARQFLIAGILAGLLAGCATPPSAPINEAELALTNAIAALETQTPDQQAAQVIRLIQQLNSLGRPAEALNLAQRYPVGPEQIEHYPSYGLALAQTHIALGNDQNADKVLTEALNNPTAFMGLADEIQLISARVPVLDRLGLALRAFEDLVYLSILQPAEQTSATRDALWQRAQNLTGQTTRDPSSEAAGWLALAAVPQSDNPSAAALVWFRAWPDHPALESLPPEVAGLLNLEWPAPSRIGLILPLSGELAAVGESVLDGVMNQRLASSGPTLVVADGAQGLTHALKELRTQQVDLILGPLPKADVQALLALNPQEAVLALNYSDLDLTDARAPRALMGLSPEDSARDAAGLLAGTSDKRPLVLVPGDTLGERIAAAFAQHWPDNESRAPIIQRYLNDDQRQIVSNALGIEGSQARHKHLAQALGLELEFTPRRRQDVGAVYIYGDSITAAQLKPLLAFYYAGDLPVWLADSALDQNLDLVQQDLIGANIVAMPWQTDGALESNVLYELGADAWMLASALANPDQLAIMGRTGEWFRDGQTLRRNLVPVQLTQRGFVVLPRPAPEPEQPLAADDESPIEPSQDNESELGTQG